MGFNSGFKGLTVQVSLPHNKTGRASVLYNFILVFLRVFGGLNMLFKIPVIFKYLCNLLSMFNSFSWLFCVTNCIQRGSVTEIIGTNLHLGASLKVRVSLLKRFAKFNLARQILWKLLHRFSWKSSTNSSVPHTASQKEGQMDLVST